MNGGQNTVTWKICDEIQSNCKTARTDILNKKTTKKHTHWQGEDTGAHMYIIEKKSTYIIIY